MANGVLLYAELDGGKLAPIVAEMAGIGARLASDLGCDFEAGAIGAGVDAATGELGRLGVSTVYLVDDPAFASYQNDPYIAALTAIAEKAQPAAILFGQTFQARDLAPRLAFRLKTGIAMDCLDLSIEEGKLVMEKPMYGGNARAKMVAASHPQMASIRAKAFPPAEPGAGSARIESVTLEAPTPRARLVERVEADTTGEMKLEDAAVVVSGGRGMGDAESFQHLESLAALFNGAVGASRGAVDAGFQPTERQIGLSGKVVSPDLYFAVALSGAAQHMAGCSGARNIIAINRDEDASVFKFARFGVVGQWQEVLPAFIEKCRELLG